MGGLEVDVKARVGHGKTNIYMLSTGKRSIKSEAKRMISFGHGADQLPYCSTIIRALRGPSPSANRSNLPRPCRFVLFGHVIVAASCAPPLATALAPSHVSGN